MAAGLKVPAVTINGQTLTDAQAMTFHVALGHFQIDLAHDADFREGLGAELHGAYAAHARAIMQLIVKGEPGNAQG